MVRLEYSCKTGHRWERVSQAALKRPRCPECGKRGEIFWTTGQSDGFLKEAVLVFRLADGRLSFPGRNDVRTPKGAERMELRKASEVRKIMKDYNSYASGKEAQREEGYLKYAERQQSERRAKLTYLMGQESDPAAKDLYREALKRAEYEPSPRYQEFYWEAGE